METKGIYGEWPVVSSDVALIGHVERQLVAETGNVIEDLNNCHDGNSGCADWYT